MTQPKAKKASPSRKRIYFTVRELADPDTGELVGALVPSSPVDRALMRRRKFAKGHEVRADLTKARNPKFHRLVHALGLMVSEHVEAFQDMDAHETLKQLQVEANVCCEVQTINATPVVAAVLKAAESLLGGAAARMLQAVLPEIKTIEVKVAQSMAFDEMDETEFRRLFDRICRYVAETYWPDLDQETITAMAGMMPEAT